MPWQVHALVEQPQDINLRSLPLTEGPGCPLQDFNEVLLSLLTERTSADKALHKGGLIVGQRNVSRGHADRLTITNWHSVVSLVIEGE